GNLLADLANKRSFVLPFTLSLFLADAGIPVTSKTGAEIAAVHRLALAELDSYFAAEGDEGTDEGAEEYLRNRLRGIANKVHPASGSHYDRSVGFAEELGLLRAGHHDFTAESIDEFVTEAGKKRLMGKSVTLGKSRSGTGPGQPPPDQHP